jgi:aspartate/methionine/tyrosine aminotransferase
MSAIDLGWGEPYCVREALSHYYKRKALTLVDVRNLKYCPDSGDPRLVNLTRHFLRQTTGIDYKYIIITHGTTGAINVVLRSLFREEGRDTCFTHKYIFPYYPDIIKKNGYQHKNGLYKSHELNLSEENCVGLVDSPTNPDGNLVLYTDTKNNIIWDSVYHNPVFINSTIAVKPDHRVNCGGYSKVLGLTGARVGWIATNNKEDYEMFLKENLYETCTMSFFSQDFIVDVLNNTDLENFMRSAKYQVNNNREMLDKICYLFDGQQVPENGMFYPVWASKYACDLLESLEIKTVKLDQEGKDSLIRFNLAQTNQLTQKAVRFILKKDCGL